MLFDALQQIRGARILVVEDNPVTQQVMGEILRRAGLTVEAVGCGSDAVAAIATGAAFDLVLMDVQMPDMDGCQATTLIRDLPGGASLPVVAMTAHAGEAGRERCLAAGMNDHLAKPVDFGMLGAVLLRWVRPGQNVPASGDPSLSPAPAATASSEEHFPDILPGIDVKAALGRVMGNGRLLRRIMADFRDGYLCAVEEIRGNLERGEFREARRLLHTLKGMAANLGADALAARARELEATLRENRVRDLPPLLDRLAAELALVLASAGSLAQAAQAVEAVEAVEAGAVEAGAVGPAPEPAGALPPEQLATLLRGLARNLARNRMEARKEFALLKTALPALPGVATLEAGIGRLDFKSALAELELLAGKLGIDLEEPL